MPPQIIQTAKVLELPAEMTSAIFMECLPERGSLSSASAPVILCHICHEWRQLALTLQCLWDSVQFNDAPSLVGLKDYATRAPSRPLNHAYDICSPYHARHMGDACRAFSEQWQDLNLALPLEGFKEITKSGVTAFPRLCRINIQTARGFSAPLPLQFDLPSSPLLRYAQLGYNPRLRMSLPWAQLTVLALTSRIPFSMRTLEQCTSLVHFTFRLKMGWFTPNPPPPPIIHELQYLVLQDYPFLLLSVTLPKLEELSLSLTLEDNPDFCGSYRAFLSHSSCPLIRLTINVQDEDVIHFCDALRAAASVLELQINFYSKSRSELHLVALTVQGVLPKLKILVVQDMPLTYLTYPPPALPRGTPYGPHGEELIALRRALHKRNGHTEGFARLDTVILSFKYEDRRSHRISAPALWDLSQLALRGLALRVEAMIDWNRREILIDTLDT
ncbi:hypothetical protein C8J57DRAFT_1673608 [Mycena rebaudengoi]|nr:hypothetical protein C8J57DRAFT_1673608 [Mycena rebaudengoi]